MSENEKDSNKIDPSASKPTDESTKATVDEEEQGDKDEDEFDDDFVGGFDPEQKRFLWTLAGVIVLGTLMAAAAVVLYLNVTHSKDAQIAEVTEEYRDKRTAVEDETKQRKSQLLFALRNMDLARNDADRGRYREMANNVLNRIIALNVDLQNAYVAMRQTKGFEAKPYTDDEIRQMGDSLSAGAQQEVRQLSQMDGQGRPTTMGMATQPAIPSTSPTAPPPPAPATMP